jgi:RHS repeat-associated protein
MRNHPERKKTSENARIKYMAALTRICQATNLLLYVIRPKARTTLSCASPLGDTKQLMHSTSPCRKTGYSGRCSNVRYPPSLSESRGSPKRPRHRSSAQLPRQQSLGALGQAYNGYLVCVNDQNELEWLGERLLLAGIFWLGAQQCEEAATPEEGWGWVDGGDFDWLPRESPWYHTQPDDADGAESHAEDVAVWLPEPAEDPGWHDWPADDDRLGGIVVERQPFEDVYPDYDGNAVWIDYLGGAIYGEYTVDPDTGDVTKGRSYLFPAAHHDPGQPSPSYYHHDEMGSTRNLTAADGGIIRSAVYTTFGEPVYSSGPNETRYGYVGGHGYENLLGTPFLHVGARWYDPLTGRFVQHDPTGIMGGLNTYAYAYANPVALVDPDGLGLLK